MDDLAEYRELLGAASPARTPAVMHRTPPRSPFRRPDYDSGVFLTQQDEDETEQGEEIEDDEHEISNAYSYYSYSSETASESEGEQDDVTEDETALDESQVEVELPVIVEDDVIGAADHGTRAVVAATDADVEEMSDALDVQMGRMKQDLLMQFCGIKRRMMDEERVRADEREQLFHVALAAKQDEMERVKEEAAALMDLLAHKDTALGNMALLMGARYRHEVDARAQKAVFAAWRQRAAAWKARRVAEARAAEHYKHAQMRRALLDWQAKSRAGRRRRDFDEWQKRAQDDRDQLCSLFQEKIDLLESQLEHAQERVREEETTRRTMEENMKKAFMRGVCALNLEAMTIMKRSKHADDGHGFGAEDAELMLGAAAEQASSAVAMMAAEAAQPTRLERPTLDEYARMDEQVAARVAAEDAAAARKAAEPVVRKTVRRTAAKTHHTAASRKPADVRGKPRVLVEKFHVTRTSDEFPRTAPKPFRK